MIPLECRSVSDLLAPYVDGELSGADRLRVARHVEACAGCRAEVASVAAIGDALRTVAGVRAPGETLEGLAPGVVARVGAESAVSWRALWDRAVGDSRWLLVGTGSVAGAFASTTLVIWALFAGTAPVSSDSLAARLAAFESTGTLFVVATAQDRDRGAVLVQVNSAGPSPTQVVLTEAELTGPSQGQLTGMLADAVTRGGRVVDLAELPRRDREYAVALLDEMGRRRTTEIVRVAVQELRFVTSTDVSAKGL